MSLQWDESIEKQPQQAETRHLHINHNHNPVNIANLIQCLKFGKTIYGSNTPVTIELYIHYVYIYIYSSFIPNKFISSKHPVYFAVLVVIVNANLYKTEPIFTGLGQSKMSSLLTLITV